MGETPDLTPKKTPCRAVTRCRPTSPCASRERYPPPLGPVAETLGLCASNFKRYVTRCPAPFLPASLTLGTTGPPRSSCRSREELRITRVFSCVARGFKARPSFMFAGCCWWRSLAIDGSSGTSRGHGYRMIDPLLTRSVCAAGQPACTQVSRYTGLSGSDREFPALTG